MKQLNLFHLLFRDKNGNLYRPEEVVFADVDTPGPQYLGYITKESFDKTNCINKWICVKIRGDLDCDKIETEEIDGGTIVKGVYHYKKT